MEIAATLIAFLTPFLPHLMKLGQPVAESSGKALGDELGKGSWKKAKQLWDKLWPGVKTKPIAKASLEELANNSDDTDAQEALIPQLKKLLAENPMLATEIQQCLEEDTEIVSQVVKITQTVAGDNNIVMGQNIGNVNIQQ